MENSAGWVCIFTLGRKKEASPPTRSLFTKELVHKGACSRIKSMFQEQRGLFTNKAAGSQSGCQRIAAGSLLCWGNGRLEASGLG